ncbi:hypothetical protein CAPTEDRAFT_204555, partial [Capitella teleta]
MQGLMLMMVVATLSFWHGASGQTGDKYLTFNMWTEDAYALNLLRVKTSSLRVSRIECCVLCSRDETCFGAAWNEGTRECQMATEPDAVAYVDLVAVDNWKFMVTEEFVCGTE